MPVYSYCENCFSSGPIKADVCKNCGQAYGRQRRYKASVKVRGKQKTQIFPNLTLARDMETHMKSDLLRGLFEGKIEAWKKKYPTLDVFFERYIEYAKGTKKTWKDDVRYYNKNIRPVFGRKRLDKITPSQLDDFKLALTKRGLKPQTVKHQLALIRHMFNLAIRWREFDGLNPMASVAMPKVDNQITRMLTDEQTDRLHEILESYTDDILKNLFLLAMYTGLRKGEILQLRWIDIDDRNMSIFIDKPKGGKSIHLQVSPAAIDIVRNIPKIDETYLFPGKQPGAHRHDIKRPWKNLKIAAGLPDDFRFHDLRHNYASRLASKGYDLNFLKELLTHKDIVTTQRYAHLLPGAVREKVNGIADIIRNKKPKDYTVEEGD